MILKIQRRERFYVSSHPALEPDRSDPDGKILKEFLEFQSTEPQLIKRGIKEEKNMCSSCLYKPKPVKTPMVLTNVVSNQQKEQ
ncbi:MAG: hypothetical protein H6868_01260 [Rhodospirillales bacterium]|nr:hypothetical protein [Rhodospirillales bacterium]